MEWKTVKYCWLKGKIIARNEENCAPLKTKLRKSEGDGRKLKWMIHNASLDKQFGADKQWFWRVVLKLQSSASIYGGLCNVFHVEIFFNTRFVEK